MMKFPRFGSKPTYLPGPQQTRLPDFHWIELATLKNTVLPCEPMSWIAQMTIMTIIASITP